METSLIYVLNELYVVAIAAQFITGENMNLIHTNRGMYVSLFSLQLGNWPQRIHRVKFRSIYSIILGIK